MLKLTALVLYGSILVTAAPQNGAARAGTGTSFTGTWRLGTGVDELVLERAGDSIHVKEQRNGKVQLEYTCKTDGKDCDSQEDGHKARVSLWFNGPYLVELRTHGDTIVKRRLLIRDNPDAMQIEVMPMSPAGPTEVLAYLRDGK